MSPVNQVKLSYIQGAWGKIKLPTSLSCCQLLQKKFFVSEAVHFTPQIVHKTRGLTNMIENYVCLFRSCKDFLMSFTG